MSESENLGLQFDLPKENSSIIKVIGVGGGGSNAVNYMYDQGIVGVDFIVCNTDRQALNISPVPLKVQLGASLTDGCGAGAIPEIGRNSAIENIEDIREFLGKGTKMVFVTAGMGGGTGTGAAPVIAEVARELGILTVGIVTIPFGFEGRKRRQQAEDGIEEMRKNVDTLLVINNERLREMSGNLTIGNAFAQADNVLTIAAKGIAEVISVTGNINVDFNDVNTVMKNSGVAIMGSAAAEGENRAIEAVQNALSSPLLNDNDISGAKYVLLNITYGDKEVLMDEITAITDYIQDESGSTADVIWGHGYDATLGDKLSVTLIATNFNTAPLTGLDKAPERVVRKLEEETKKEIVQPLNSPTQKTETTIRNEEQIDDTPFIKTAENENNKEVRHELSGENLNEDQIEERRWELDEKTHTETENIKEWDFVDEAKEEDLEAKKEISEPEIIVHKLEDPVEKRIEEEEHSRKNVLSNEEQQRRAQERLTRIKEYTDKIKKADGLNELEKEPAYLRQNIQLDNSNHSKENNISRFGISKDENGNNLRGNNSFLHDNVD
ncbi:MAG: cell division protein FtsZ [Crocinitomicaceae bacterium]